MKMLLTLQVSGQSIGQISFDLMMALDEIRGISDKSMYVCIKCNGNPVNSFQDNKTTNVKDIRIHDCPYEMS